MNPRSEPQVEPTWIRDGIRASLGELRAFFSTAYRFARHPARFARAWVQGEERALNPAAMMATAASFTLVVRLLLEKMAKVSGGDESLLGQMLDAIGPHLHYAGLGLLAHGVMRLAGSRRRGGSSIAVALFAGAGPAWVSEMITIAYFTAMMAFERTPDSAAWGVVPNVVLAMIAIGTFLAFAATLCAGLSGLHGLRWGWSVLAVALALVASALVFGALPAEVPGKYGLHLVLRLPIHGAKLGLGLRD